MTASNTLTIAQLRDQVGADVAFDRRGRVNLGASRSKYGNRRTYVAELDRTFDSQREADCAVRLLRRQQSGEIRNLEFQVRRELDVDGCTVCSYVSDFDYEERNEYGDWVLVVADAKGARTPVYRLKKRLMLACRGIDVVEL